MVSGQIYFALKALYDAVIYSVRLNRIYTDWFDVNIGVKQGYILSPTLFSIFINDLVGNINALGLGIQIEDLCQSILLFADDIALISDTEESHQAMLDSLSDWCNKWRLQISPEKTKVVQFITVNKPMTDF